MIYCPSFIFINILCRYYFRDIGGFNAKESVNLCLKDCMEDNLSLSFTWRGRNNQQPFYRTRLVMAIFGIMIFLIAIYTYNNDYYQYNTSITLLFQMQYVRTDISKNRLGQNFNCIWKRLSGTQKRVRSKLSGPRKPRAQRNISRDFWNDERHEDEEETESPNEN